MYYKVRKLKWSHIDTGINERHKNNTEKEEKAESDKSLSYK